MSDKENPVVMSILVVCAVAAATSMVQIGFLLSPISERAADINQCVEERTSYWIKNEKNPGAHTKSRLTSWCNGGRSGK